MGLDSIIIADKSILVHYWDNDEIIQIFLWYFFLKIFVKALKPFINIFVSHIRFIIGNVQLVVII